MAVEHNIADGELETGVAIAEPSKAESEKMSDEMADLAYAEHIAKKEGKPADEKPADDKPEEKPAEEEEEIPTIEVEPADEPAPKADPEGEPEEKPAEDEKPEDFEKSMVDHYKDDLAISEDEAQEIVDKEKAYAEKYNAPYTKENQKLVKANRHLQSNHDRLIDKVKSYEERAEDAANQEIPEQSFVDAIKANTIQLGGKARTQEEVVEAYIDKHPEAADFNEDAVVLLAAKIFKQSYDKDLRVHVDKVKGKAKTKRTELLDGISDDDSEFKKELKEILLATPDQIIAKDSYSFDRVKRYVRGNAYVALKDSIAEKEKAADKRGYDRGFSDRKIKGKKSSAVSTGAPANTETSSAHKNLDENEQSEARYMFRDFPDDTAFQMYYDLKKRKKT